LRSGTASKSAAKSSGSQPGAALADLLALGCKYLAPLAFQFAASAFARRLRADKTARQVADSFYTFDTLIVHYLELSPETRISRAKIDIKGLKYNLLHKNSISRLVRGQFRPKIT
jgi:hypothetical protein